MRLFAAVVCVALWADPALAQRPPIESSRPVLRQSGEEPERPPLARPYEMDGRDRDLHRCGADVSERVVSGNEKFCLSVLLATRRVEDPSKPSIVRATFRLNYYQPGPLLNSASDKRVGWNDSDIRVDCATGAIWVISVVVRSFDHGEVLSHETPSVPRAGPSTAVDNPYTRGACY